MPADKQRGEGAFDPKVFRILRSRPALERGLGAIMPAIDTGQDSRHERRDRKKSKKKHFQKCWLIYGCSKWSLAMSIFENRKENGERGGCEYLASFCLLKSSIKRRLLTVVVGIHG
jgi:hypothetical protein